jgi:hypothetical protein
LRIEAMQTLAVVFAATAAVAFAIVAVGVLTFLQFMILIVDEE